MSIFHSHTTRVSVIEKTYIFIIVIDTPMGMFHVKNIFVNQEPIRSYKKLKRERVRMKILMFTETDKPTDMFHTKFIVVCHNFVYFLRRFDISVVNSTLNKCGHIS